MEYVSVCVCVTLHTDPRVLNKLVDQPLNYEQPFLLVYYFSTEISSKKQSYKSH